MLLLAAAVVVGLLGNAARQQLRTNVDVRLVALVDGGVGAGEVQGRRPGLALQRHQRVLVLSEGKARRPHERGESP